MLHRSIITSSSQTGSSSSSSSGALLLVASGIRHITNRGDVKIGIKCNHVRRLSHIQNDSRAVWGSGGGGGRCRRPFLCSSSPTHRFFSSTGSTASSVADQSTTKTSIKTNTTITNNGANDDDDAVRRKCQRAKEIVALALCHSSSSSLSINPPNDSTMSNFGPGPIFLANELLQMTSECQSPLRPPGSTSRTSLWGPGQLSSLHGALVSVTRCLLYAIPSGDSSSSILLLKSMELALEAERIDLPLHLPLYRKLALAIASSSSSDRAEPTADKVVPRPSDYILQVSSSLARSFPAFDQWESFFLPVCHALLLTKYSSSSVASSLSSVTTLVTTPTQELIRVLSEAQIQHGYVPSSDDALDLLHALRDVVDLPHDSNNLEDVVELTQLLRQPIDDMIKERKRQMDRVSREMVTTLANAVDMDPEEVLRTVLDDDDDDDDLDMPEEVISMIRQVEDDDDDEKDNKSNKNADSIKLSTKNTSPTQDLSSTFVESTHPKVTSTTTTFTKTVPTLDTGHDQMVKLLLYFRDDSQEWSLPDVTEQLAKWNGSLRYTQKYEEELVRQIQDEDEEDPFHDHHPMFDDDDDDDDHL